MVPLPRVLTRPNRASWVTMQGLKECHQLLLYIGERCGHTDN
jgi:hypothetical protein